MVEELEEAVKNWKEKKHLQYFIEKEECYFFYFLAFVKFLCSISLVITPELLHEMLWFLFDLICIKSMIFSNALEKSWENIWIFFVKTQLAHCITFFSKFKGRLLDGFCMAFKKFLEQIFLSDTFEQLFVSSFLHNSQCSVSKFPKILLFH